MSVPVDFAYVIDCTGSMSSWINQVKTDIKKVVDYIGVEFPHIELRLGCVAYRDWSDGAKRLEKLNFTTNVMTFKNWVGNLRADGGGDTCEDVLGGLSHCTSLDWSSDCRVLFHICDAPPHNTVYHNGANDSWPDGYDGSHGGSADPHDYHKLVLRELQEREIHLCIGKLNSSVEKMISVFKDYGASIELKVEERKLSKVSDLLGAVETVLTEAITRVDISSMDSSDISELSKLADTWNPLKAKKREFQAYVGIDFGTDGTGFAYALPSGKVVWQQNHTKNLHIKDRTNILLRPEPPYKLIAFGIEATEKYKSIKDKKSLYFERFKMSLYDQELTVKRRKKGGLKFGELDDEKKYSFKDDESGKHEYISYLRAENGTEIPTEIVFTRALEYIRRVTMDTLKKTVKIKNVMDVQWILTVPAIWSNYAKSIMLTAAEDAKIKKKGIVDHVMIATEPECASVIARKTVDLSTGTKYIVLDLGGGTADIACHVAVDEHTVNQIYPPKGGPWGSSYIDEAFFDLLRQIFEKKYIEEFRLKYPNRWVALKENFRKAKHIYNGKKSLNVTLDNAFVKYIDNNHPDDVDDIFDDYKYKGEAIEYDEGIMELSTTIWNDLFYSVIQPLMDKTDELLTKEEMSGCKDILIVGGLSESEFVRDQIRNRYSTKGYRIHSVERPILAVVEGAATIGLRPSSIAKWIAPETMGIQIRRDFNSATDDESMKTWDKHSKKFVIDNGFAALIKKGTPIDPSAPPKIEWFRPWQGRGQTQVKIKLYSSHETDPDHTNEPAEGQKVIDLPKDWKPTEAFPVAYWDKGAEKKLYVAVRDWPEEDREIKIQWHDPMDI